MLYVFYYGIAWHRVGGVLQNKTISDGGITVDFSIIKVHTSNLNSPWIIRGLGIIEILRIIKFHIFLFF